MEVTLLLADDNSATRSTLRLVLEKRLEVRVVAEAANLQELYTLVSRTQPDLLVLDWELPGFKGAASLAELRILAPEMKAVALSARPEAREQSLAAGADAFVSMVEQPEALFSTIRKCCQTVCAPQADQAGCSSARP
jgi:DNA-binding NarL/FixJ family response regulator